MLIPVAKPITADSGIYEEAPWVAEDWGSGLSQALSDEQLMQAYQSGDARAFAMLYERHSARVYGYLNSRLRERVQTDDVFQGVFLKLHRFRHRYDPSFPFVPWLYTVCRSVLLDHLRKAGRICEEAVGQEVLEAIEGSQPAAASEAALAGLAPDRIQELMPELKPEQRLALELRYQKEFSFVEIAAALETSPVNARQLVSRAVRKVRSFVAGRGQKNGA